MNPNDFWLLLVVLVFLLALTAFWLGRGRLGLNGWKYKKETLPRLGRVTAVYLKGELLWCDYIKNGVTLQMNCQIPGNKEVASKVAQTFTQPDIDRHLQQAIRAIPEDEIKAWGFDQGKWRTERVIINGENSFVFELGNSHDRDHCCRVILENGSYEFEAVDG